MSANIGSTPESDLAHYEGLVYKTARMIVGVVEEDFEDVQQILRMKVFRALRAFDPKRSKLSRDNYVFGCLMNQKTDLLRRKRHGLLMIEDLREKTRSRGDTHDGEGSGFDARHLAAEDEYDFDQEDVLIPSTVTRLERQVLLRLYARVWVHFDDNGDASKDNRAAVLRECAEEFGLSRTQIASIMASIEIKFADWRPGYAPVVALAA